MAKGSRGGKVGASGVFQRTDIPIMRTRNDDNSFEVKYVKGYSMNIDGQDINLQKNSDGYSLNINGYIAGLNTWKTLAEAKEEAPKKYAEIMKSQSNRDQLAFTGAIMNEIKKRGGRVSNSDMKKIRKDLRDKLSNK